MLTNSFLAVVDTAFLKPHLEEAGRSVLKFLKETRRSDPDSPLDANDR